MPRTSELSAPEPSSPFADAVRVGMSEPSPSSDEPSPLPRPPSERPLDWEVEREDDGRVDPAVTVLETPIPGPYAVPAALIERAMALLDDRLLILAGDDEDELSSALYAVLSHPEAARGAGRRLYLRSRFSGWKRVAERNRPGRGEPETILVLDALTVEDERDDRFVQDLRMALRRNALRQDARARRARLVLLVGPHLVDLASGPEGEGFALAVDCLPEVIRRRFADRHMAVEQAIVRARERGVPRARLLALASRSPDAAALLAQFGPDPAEPAREGLDRQLCEPLTRLLLFVAAWMPELPAEDYESVVSRLLARPELAFTRSEQAGTEFESTPAGFEWRWRQDYATLMAECGLSFRPRPQIRVGGREAAIGPAVAFVDGARLAEVRRRFEETHYFDFMRYVDAIRRSGLLFHRSYRVMVAVVEVVVAAASRRTDVFGRDWLLGLIASAGPEGLPVGEPADDAQARFAAMLESAHREHQQLVYARVIRLAERMLSAPGLAPAVDEILGALLTTPNLRHGVLRITRGLAGQPGFVEERWIRRLLDETSPDVQQGAYQLLVECSITSGPSRLWDAVAGWLPRRAYGQLPPVFSSGWASLELAIHLMEQSVAGISDTASTPTAVRLVVQRALGDAARRGPFLDWLLHPAVDLVLQSRVQYHLFGLVEHWLLPEAVRRGLSDEGRALSVALADRWRSAIREQRAREVRLVGHHAGRQLLLALFLADATWSATHPWSQEDLDALATDLVERLRRAGAAPADSAVDRISHFLLVLGGTLMDVMVELRLAPIRPPLPRGERESLRTTLSAARQHVLRVRASMLAAARAYRPVRGSDVPRL